MLNELISQLSDAPCDGAIYLLCKLRENIGFFSVNKKLLYIIRNEENVRSQNIDTDYLTLKTHIAIHAVENMPQFESGDYNMIQYNGETSDINFESFARLCVVHSQNADSLGFGTFFYSLINLFQLPREQQIKNLIGLYGELKFIEYVYKKYAHDISLSWHGKSTDKYDFVCKNVNFEIKTTNYEDYFVKIKHEQIFNGANNYLVVINIQDDNSGESLSELIERMKHQSPFSEHFEFHLNLEREIRRVSMDSAEKRKFTCLSIISYNVSNLSTFEDIPERISNITYNYNFSGLDEDSLSFNLFE